ncbi:pyridoxal phosphate-dependent transferase [Pilobolus umbonatus]|nr:pyridoxal phosphate-dependent transferase [Pilobolus umbonatus]
MALSAVPKEVGESIPAHTPHALSVMFPTWQDNIYYEEGNPIVTSKMQSGYPRFFIHPCIQKLCGRLVDKFGQEGDAGMLFPTYKIAEQCRSFMDRYYRNPTGTIRIVEFKIASIIPAAEQSKVSVYIILFPKDAFPIAKQFWQHTGDTVSSRMAEYCLRILDENQQQASSRKDSDLFKPKQSLNSRSRNYYSTRANNTVEEKTEKAVEQTTYVEERYGRNLPIQFAKNAKTILRRRIAGLVSSQENDNPKNEQIISINLEEQKQVKGERGIRGLTEDDVYIYPCGMSAIYHAHQIAMMIGDRSLKSVSFGFPYTDTLKILQKWGAGCHFYGIGEEEDLDRLEKSLISGERILSLFCESPSNPLLKTPNLKKLRSLADQYQFMIVVDDTIGNFCNVNVLEWADMVVSSLTKIFSGDANVMGGSMILNPNRRFYKQLKEALAIDYEDIMWPEDAVFLERNSRSFRKRSSIINQNTEALCAMLKDHEKVEKVYYPKYVCKDNYDSLMTDSESAGYGGLFSVVFKCEQHAIDFYDNLDCAKGPSLGTNFTLASPYAILAHYTELDWAKKYEVCPYLVRVSVGLESREKLMCMFKKALDSITQ